MQLGDHRKTRLCPSCWSAPGGHSSRSSGFAEPSEIIRRKIMAVSLVDIYVVWHPEDEEGQNIADWLLDHFQGTPYSGLIGGSIEVYVRSSPWRSGSEAPRAMQFPELARFGGQGPRFSVVVPVLGVHLARAVESPSSAWGGYLASVSEAARAADNVGVFPIRLPGCESAVDDPLGPFQAMSSESAHDSRVLCREIAQQIAQMVEGESGGSRLTIFCSYTKKRSEQEKPEHAADILTRVRSRIADTHLGSFVDVCDLQPGSDWQADLHRAVESSSMLAVRTDRYPLREWCQREFLAAKRADRPIVVLHAVRRMSERGSFLMGHVPVVAYRRDDEEAEDRSIDEALNLLVDRTLSRSLWNALEAHLADLGVDWAPHEPPEPVTALAWLSRHPDVFEGRHMLIMHPDPPLGPAERETILEFFRLAGSCATVDVVTPRTYADRGGKGL